MGFFDKLKQAKNFMTGGGVKIYIETPTTALERGQIANITVKADVDSIDVNVRQVYFKVRAIETAKVEATTSSSTTTTRSSGNSAASALRGTANTAVGSNGGSTSGSQTHTATANTYNQEIVLEGEVELKAEGNYEWTASFEIPMTVNPTYRGVNAQHEWQVYAGLDTRGNDPDSGWKNIEVR